MSAEQPEAPLQILKWQFKGKSGAGVNRAFTIKRRELVAKLMLQGLNSTEIQQHIKTFYKQSISTVVICDDMKKLRKQWQDNALASTNEHLTKEIAKCDALEDTLCAALEASEISVKDYVTEHARIMKRRAAMLGLDKAQKVELHDKRTSELSDAELEAVIKTADKGAKAK